MVKSLVLWYSWLSYKQEKRGNYGRFLLIFSLKKLIMFHVKKEASAGGTESLWMILNILKGVGNEDIGVRERRIHWWNY